MIAFKVFGTPIPKGSMRCLGRGSRGMNHRLVDNNDKKLTPWQDAVAAGSRSARTLHGLVDGPCRVTLVFTLPRPESTTVRKRPWPHLRSAGDLDKLTRGVLDGLQAEGGVLADDAAVVLITAAKFYPDTPYPTPGVIRLDRPGCLIRLEALT